MCKILLSVIFLLIIGEVQSQTIAEWNEKASENIHSKKYQEAIRNYTEIIKLNPNDSAVYFDRGFAKQLAKDYSGSILDFGKAIEMDSSNPDNFYLRAVSKMYMKDFMGAKHDFSEALHRESENADVYFYRALAENELGEYKNALLDFNKAIELNSDHSQEALGNSAWSKAKLHQYKSALHICKKAKAMKQKDALNKGTRVSSFCWCYFHRSAKKIQ